MSILIFDKNNYCTKFLDNRLFCLLAECKEQNNGTIIKQEKHFNYF